MAEDNRQHRQHVIQANLSEQQANNSRTAPTQYRDKKVPCSGCGKRLLWTAEQQRYWYEEMKASVYAAINLRCDNCRKMGATTCTARRHGRSSAGGTEAMDNPPLERTAGAVYFTGGRASRVRRRGRSTALRYPAEGHPFDGERDEPRFGVRSPGDGRTASAFPNGLGVLCHVRHRRKLRPHYRISWMAPVRLGRLPRSLGEPEGVWAANRARDNRDVARPILALGREWRRDLCRPCRHFSRAVRLGVAGPAALRAGCGHWSDGTVPTVEDTGRGCNADRGDSR